MFEIRITDFPYLLRGDIVRNKISKEYIGGKIIPKSVWQLFTMSINHRNHVTLYLNSQPYRMLKTRSHVVDYVIDDGKAVFGGPFTGEIAWVMIFPVELKRGDVTLLSDYGKQLLSTERRKVRAYGLMVTRSMMFGE
jgi:hypothetical protein